MTAHSAMPAGAELGRGRYFPVTVSGFDHPSWRMWCLAFPQARVWPADAEDARVYHVDDLPRCRTVVVGIPGIPDQIAADWTFSDKRVLPDDVRAALVVQATP